MEFLWRNTVVTSEAIAVVVTGNTVALVIGPD